MKTTDEILEIMSEHLQEVNSDQKERLSRINKMLDFIMWNKRMTELTDEERESMASALGGGYLSDAQRQKLDGLKTKKEKDIYLDDMTRAEYFRRCAWLEYLGGNRSEKPFVAKKEKQIVS